MLWAKYLARSDFRDARANAQRRLSTGRNPSESLTVSEHLKQESTVVHAFFSGCGSIRVLPPQGRPQGNWENVMTKKWLVPALLVALVFPSSMLAEESKPSADVEKGTDAARITAVAVHSQQERVSVEIISSRPVKPSLSRVVNPVRLVLDFPDTVSAYLHNRINVNRSGLKSIRIGIQAANPPATRLVFDLDEPLGYQLVSDGNRLTVKLQPSDQKIADWEAGVNSQAASTTDPKPAVQETPSDGTEANVEQAAPTANAADRSKIDLPQADPPPAKEPATVNAQQAPREATSIIAAASPQPGLNSANSSNEQASTEPPDPNPKAEVLASAKPMLPRASAQEAPGGANASNHDPGRLAPAAASESQREKGPAPSVDKPSSPAPTKDATGPSTDSVSNLPLTAEAKAGLDLPSPQVDTPVANKAEERVPAGLSEYVIGEQDVLTIVVWKERELSGTVTVRPDGKITLPLVNEIKVVGMTPAQLQTVLTEKFKPFLTVPQVTVEVNQINSRRVYLIGEVQKTGTYILNSTTTVLQVIAEAGGFRDFAKPKDIYILRNQGGKQTRYPFNYPDVIRGKRPEQNIVLQPGDLIVVP